MSQSSDPNPSENHGHGSAPQHIGDRLPSPHSSTEGARSYGLPMPADYDPPGAAYSAPQTWRTAGSGDPVPGNPASPYPSAAPVNPVMSADGSVPSQTLVEFPAITVTSTEVHTPAGSIPLKQARFLLANRTLPTSATPTYAIVLSVVGFFFLTVFSLLFLLIKERSVTGTMEVTVTGGGISYTTSVPVTNAFTVSDITNRVAYAQQLTR